jgi:long-chain acyl-CoA synthetase
MESLIDLLESTTDEHRDRPAVAMCRGLGTDTWTYARLWHTAGAVATDLREGYGVQAGDRVLVRAPNSPELVTVHLGCLLAGAILVPLDDNSTDAFTQQVSTATEASLMISTPERDAATHGMRVIRMSELRSEGTPSPALARPHSDDVAEIVYTSGTTGSPKGVVLTHGNILANVRSGERAGVLPRSDRYRLLSLLPLSHMFEQTAGLYLPLSYGASITYLPTRQPSTVFRALRRQHITGMVAVPLILELLWRGIEHEVRRRGSLSSWKKMVRAADSLPLATRRLLFGELHTELGGTFEFFLCGGAHLSRAIETGWERLGVRVIQGYGATECSPVIAANTFQRRVRGSVGRPVPDVRVRLSADGEVQVKGRNVTAGYWNDVASTQAAFTADGWYCSGDLAETTDRGDMLLRGRLRDLIVLPNGLNVFPQDVEQALESEPEIAESAVLGVADESRGGLHLHAVIVPSRHDAEAVPRQELDAAVRRANARLAPYQRVVDFSVRTAESLPRTGSGKIKRFMLQISPTTGEPFRADPPSMHTSDGDWNTQIGRLVADVARVSLQSLTADTALDLDLHMDSLARVEIAVRLEEELGIGLDESQLAELTTLGDLAHFAEHADRTTQDLDVAFPRWALTRGSRLLRHAFQSTVLFPLHAVVCRPFQVSGREYLQGLDLPVLFVANHASHMDTPTVLRALPASIRARTSVAAAADYFYQDRRVGIAASLLLNTFPFSRVGAVRPSLEYCAELVNSGWSILLYPEGTRSSTGRLQSFKSGIGLLGRELGVPIVPVAVDGTYTILPKGRRLPRRGPVRVCFGSPVPPRPDLDASSITAVLERAEEELLYADALVRASGATRDVSNARG